MCAHAIDADITFYAPISVAILLRSAVASFTLPAEPAWRDALSRPELRGYAKGALETLAADDLATPIPADFELTDDDLAWMLTDALVADGWDDVDDDAGQDPDALAEWMRNYQVRLGVATNPKARLPVALKQVGTLDERDLRLIAKSRNVPAAIAAQARRILLTTKAPK